MKLNHHTYEKGINLGCLEFINWRQVLYGCRKCCIFVGIRVKV